MTPVLPLAIAADGEDVERVRHLHDDHRISGNDGGGLALHGVPEEVAADDDVGAARIQALEPRDEGANDDALQEVLGHRLVIALRVDDVVDGRWIGQWHAHHATPFVDVRIWGSRFRKGTKWARRSAAKWCGCFALLVVAE